MAIDIVKNKNRPAHVLLVDDNNGDIILTKHALKSAKTSILLDVATSGEVAMAKLLKKDGFIDAVTPDLILLDLNLPRMDGHQILNLIKNEDNIKHIPVIILSGSRLDRDVVKSYDSHANCFLQKPFSLKALKN